MSIPRVVVVFILALMRDRLQLATQNIGPLLIRQPDSRRFI